MRRMLLIVALLLAPVAAHADAAGKAQEGEINHWIEYYEKERAAKPEMEKRDSGPGTEKQDSGKSGKAEKQDSGPASLDQ